MGIDKVPGASKGRKLRRLAFLGVGTGGAKRPLEAAATGGCEGGVGEDLREDPLIMSRDGFLDSCWGGEDSLLRAGISSAPIDENRKSIWGPLLVRSGMLFEATIGRGVVVCASSSGLKGGSGGRLPDVCLCGPVEFGDGASPFILLIDIFFRKPHLLFFSLLSFEGRRALEPGRSCDVGMDAWIVLEEA